MSRPNINHLIQNESFLNYCFKKNSEDITYWEKWLSLNPEYQNEIEDLKRTVLQLGDHIGNTVAIEEYDKLRKHITQKSSKRLTFIKYSIAASIALILSTTLYFSQKDKLNNNELAKAVVHDVAPGGNKATLTLADGTKINLSNASNGVIASKTGIKIIKTAEGQIIYQIAETNDDNAKVSYNTIEVPVGGQWQVVLPDQSKVWLNAKSTFTYPTKFIGKQRKVKITGEGYFEIAHNKLMPFMVESGSQLIEVLGTHFNVSAYADDNVIKTTLLEGAVKITGYGNPIVLKPGQQAQANQSEINVVDGVDTEEAVAWKNGDFKFKKEDIESIMRKVSRWYNVNVEYKGGISDDRFNGTISRTKNINQVLEMLETTNAVHFTVEGRRVTVMK